MRETKLDASLAWMPGAGLAATEATDKLSRPRVAIMASFVGWEEDSKKIMLLRVCEKMWRRGSF